MGELRLKLEKRLLEAPDVRGRIIPGDSSPGWGLGGSR